MAHGIYCRHTVTAITAAEFRTSNARRATADLATTQPPAQLAPAVVASPLALQTNDGLLANPAADEPVYAPRIIYQLQQSREMRSDEFHYVDHPALGLIVTVLPYEVPPLQNLAPRHPNRHWTSSPSVATGVGIQYGGYQRHPVRQHPANLIHGNGLRR